MTEGPQDDSCCCALVGEAQLNTGKPTSVASWEMERGRDLCPEGVELWGRPGHLSSVWE